MKRRTGRNDIKTRISKWAMRVTSAARLDELTDLVSWRASLVRAVAFIMFVAIPVAAAVSFPSYWVTGRYDLIALDIVVWGWSLFAIFWHRRGYRVRAMLMLFIFAAMTTSFFVSLGPAGPRAAWLVTLVVLSALLFGIRGVLVATAFNFALLFSLWFFADVDNGHWHFVLLETFGEWLNYVINTNILAIGCGLAVGLLLKGLERTLAKQEDARKQLQSERVELQRAYDRLLEQSQEQARLEKSLRQAQKLEAVGRLAGGIAHDLNNVLVPILGYADLAVLQTPRDSPLYGRLESIKQAGERARRLVEQVLLFNREVPPVNDRVEIGPLLEEVIDSLRSSVSPNVVLDVTIETEERVDANREALFRVFLNLAKNGVQALVDTGSFRFRVFSVGMSENVLGPQPQLQPETSYVCVEASDTGVGMGPEIAAKVFEPFFTTKPFGQGTGLGLATAHGVVTGFGGAITVDSTLGVGTTFRVFLPASNGAPLSTSDALVAPDVQGTRVLLVDDNPDTLATVQGQLEYLRCEVVCCGDGAAALAAIESGTFDLVLSDVQMPEMNGLQLSQTIIERTGLPVLLASGYVDGATLEGAKGIGVQRVITKPFSTDELARSVAQVLQDRD